MRGCQGRGVCSACYSKTYRQALKSVYYILNVRPVDNCCGVCACVCVCVCVRSIYMRNTYIWYLPARSQCKGHVLPTVTIPQRHHSCPSKHTYQLFISANSCNITFSSPAPQTSLLSSLEIPSFQSFPRGPSTYYQRFIPFSASAFTPIFPTLLINTFFSPPPYLFLHLHMWIMPLTTNSVISPPTMLSSSLFSLPRQPVHHSPLVSLNSLPPLPPPHHFTFTVSNSSPVVYIRCLSPILTQNHQHKLSFLNCIHVFTSLLSV